MVKVSVKVSGETPQARQAPGTHAAFAEISLEGNTLEVLSGWPPGIKVDFGHSLRQMQSGLPATLEVRPMKSIAANVYELKTQDERAWYRLVYLARMDDVIYVLDCFEKNSRKTAKRDLKTAGSRFAQVKKRLAEEQRDEKLSRRQR